MAKVTVKLKGGSSRDVEARTVAEVKQKLNYPNSTATVNGESAGPDYVLADDDFVMLTESIKGGI